MAKQFSVYLYFRHSFCPVHIRFHDVYKNLKRQYSLAKMTLFIYLLFVLAVILVTTFGMNGYSTKEITGVHVGVGFYVLVCGLPFTYFAMKGVQKDKVLLDSLNRLR